MRKSGLVRPGDGVWTKFFHAGVVRLPRVTAVDISAPDEFVFHIFFAPARVERRLIEAGAV